VTKLKDKQTEHHRISNHSPDGQGIKWHRNTAENYNCLSMAHERYRRQTDGRRSLKITMLRYNFKC